MKKTIDETARRRAIQMEYNLEHGITPQPLTKSKERIIESTKVADGTGTYIDKSEIVTSLQQVAEEKGKYVSFEETEKQIKAIRKEMEKAAKDLDFLEAARLRDILFELEAKRKD